VFEKLVFAVFAVIPAKAGIQSFLAFLDSRLRGSDEGIAFQRLAGDISRVGVE
jgi:hypothetical protein